MAVPSSKWFPLSLQDQAAWYQNFATQFGPLAVSLGFLPAMVTSVNADREDLAFCAQATVEVAAYGKAVRQYRNILLKGSIGDPPTNFPTNPTLNPPSQVPTGLFERLDDLVKRIRVSPAYNNDIGAALGIIPVSPSRPAPETMQPVVKAAALPSSKVNVSFVRSGTDGVAIEVKIDNSLTWTPMGQFKVSPAQLKIPENPQGLPRAVQVRGRYYENDAEIGLYSLVDTVSTVPSI